MPHTASSTLLAHPDLALATACDVACADGRRGEVRRWRPGLSPAQGAPLHSELFASGREASGAGAAVALARDWMDAATRVAPPEERVLESRAILWVQDRRAAKLTGRPYRPGLPPGWRHRLIHVLADSAEDALFALEEGLRCRDLACVIGELAGNPRELGFTEARRLSLAAERHGVPLWLVRVDAAPDLSSARMRWRIAPAASPPAPWNPQAPGDPGWRAELFRARRHPPGEWLLRASEDGLAALRDPGSGQGNGQDEDTDDAAIAAS